MNLDQLNTYLTPARRKAVYKIAALVASVLVVHQVVTADDAANYLEILGELLGVAAPLLAHAHVQDHTSAGDSEVPVTPLGYGHSPDGPGPF